jgi:sentrin-specific protease 1
VGVHQCARRFNYEAVRRQTKSIVWMETDCVVVPVNHSNAHWSLAVLWPREGRIEHYDSLGGK